MEPLETIQPEVVHTPVNYRKAGIILAVLLFLAVMVSIFCPPRKKSAGDPGRGTGGRDGRNDRFQFIGNGERIQHPGYEQSGCDLF